VVKTVSDNPFHALWTQKGHQLCTGHWEITYLELPIELPFERRACDMETWGIYSFIYEDDPDYAEGLPEEEWIVANIEWLQTLFEDYNIPFDKAHLQYFYQAINPEDWRCGSCGGCL